MALKNAPRIFKLETGHEVEVNPKPSLANGISAAFVERYLVYANDLGIGTKQAKQKLASALKEGQQAAGLLQLLAEMHGELSAQLVDDEDIVEFNKMYNAAFDAVQQQAQMTEEQRIKFALQARRDAEKNPLPVIVGGEPVTKDPFKDCVALTLDEGTTIGNSPTLGEKHPGSLTVKNLARMSDVECQQLIDVAIAKYGRGATLDVAFPNRDRDIFWNGGFLINHRRDAAKYVAELRLAGFQVQLQPPLNGRELRALQKKLDKQAELKAKPGYVDPHRALSQDEIDRLLAPDQSAVFQPQGNVRLNVGPQQVSMRSGRRNS